MTETQIDTANTVIDTVGIMELLPHRYPILLVDRVVELVDDERIVGVKNVSMGDSVLQGHFPGQPIWPGVLTIEALAQVGGILAMKSGSVNMDDKIVLFMGIENAKFRRPVTPGDQMTLHVEKTQARGAVWKFYGEAQVNGKVVASANFSAMLADKNQ